MKLITAIIRPDRLDEVRAALAEFDIYLMTITDVQGLGTQKGVTEVYRGQEVEERLLPKLKLEIAVNDAFVDVAIEALVRGGRTGRVGDGKIFVTALEQCVRIRTGETGSAAIGP